VTFSTTAAYDLFWEKQKFLYAVLEAKVETAKGKSIIRQYENTYDAQKAYEKLEEHHPTSNTAMFATNKIYEIPHDRTHQRWIVAWNPRELPH
jgi:glucose-6-phosphate 1-dehydrogenase